MYAAGHGHEFLRQVLSVILITPLALVFSAHQALL